MKPEDKTAEMVERFDAMVDSLDLHREAFCPEDWELYDYAFHGTDSTGEIREHVADCSQCKESVSALEASGKIRSPVSRGLLKAAEKHYDRGIAEPGVSARFADYIARFFRLPVMAAATAAAVVLLVIGLFPREGSESMLALSGVTWRTGRSLELMTPNKPKLATVVIIKDKRDKWPQSRIDSLYTALKPTKDLRKLFGFIPPAHVKQSLRTTAPVASAKEIIATLRKTLEVKRVLFLTITSADGTFNLGLQLIDGETCRVLKAKSLAGVPEQDLFKRIVRLTHFLLSPGRPEADHPGPFVPSGNDAGT